MKGRVEYAYTYIDAEFVSLHRFLLKPTREQVVDHRNHDGLDNRRGNLRVCTPGQNRLNSRRMKPGSKGVVAITKRGKRLYRARGQLNGVRIEIGTFGTRKRAARAYQAWAKEHHGEFYCSV